MNFQNIMGSDCGQENSLVQLSRHMVQDVAQQDSIGLPATSSGVAQNSFMPPQSFNMHDLMHEIETNSQSTTEYRDNQETSHNSVLSARSFKNFNMMYSRYQRLRYIGLSRPQVPVPYYYAQHNLEPQLEENLEYPSNNSGVVVQSLDELDDSYLWEEENQQTTNTKQQTLETKVQQETDSKPVSQKYFRGIPIDEERMPAWRLADMTKPHAFVSCLMDYGQKCMDEQYLDEPCESRFIKDELLQHEGEYPHIQDNPMRDSIHPFIDSQLELDKGNIDDAILYADEAARREPEKINRWFLLQHLYQTDLKKFEAFFVAKQILRLNPSNSFAHITITIAYLQYNCYFEAFETIVHWLQNHKVYADIPMNFTMVENSIGLDGFAQTWIELNRRIITGVQNMLLTAARRKPINPDCAVQAFLSYIFSFTRDYNKSSDCLTTIMHSDRKNRFSSESCYNTGFNLFLSDKPYEALRNLLIGFENSKGKIKTVTCKLLGIIYMYLTDYREAIRYFKEGLEIDPWSVEFALPDRGDIVKAEHDLCLQLYCKLHEKVNS